jgi:putative hydrolase of the HAD superfamily
VQVVAVWRTVLSDLARRGMVDATASRRADVARLAVEYEVRANPVWPMPGAVECLRVLRAKSLVLGIVSNAQFYTPELFPALLGQPAEQLGFDPKLQHYSYRHGRAKPGLALFQAAAEALAARGIAPGQALYVGNDMLNDVLPAGRLGFRTALFAGDRRSFRERRDDPRVRGVVPDLVLTELRQLQECIIV